MADQSIYSPGYADLQRAEVPTDVLQHIVTRYANNGGAAGVTQSGAGGGIESNALLAALLTSANGIAPKVRTYSVHIPDFVLEGYYQKQQVLPANPTRKGLILSINYFGVDRLNHMNIGVLFAEDNISSPVPVTSGDLNNMLVIPLEQPFEFQHAPGSAITIINLASIDAAYNIIVTEMV